MLAQGSQFKAHVKTRICPSKRRPSQTNPLEARIMIFLNIMTIWLLSPYNLFFFFFTKTTAWKVSKYEVFSGPYFPAFKLNMKRYGVSFRSQSKCPMNNDRLVGLIKFCAC